MLAAAAMLVSGCGSTTTVQKQPPTENPDGSLNVAIKVLKHGAQVIALVPVTIDGKGPYTFALDTGASQSLVDSSVAKELDVKPTGDTHKVAGISSVTQVKSIAVERWRVGKVQLPATTLVEENLQKTEATIRALASSRKAMTCSRETVGNPLRNSSMESPASR